MDDQRKQAYSMLLSAAFLHLKWDLAAFVTGISLWRPWELLRESHRIRKASHRAFTFHNLAIFLSNDLIGFREEKFWKDVDDFTSRYPDWADYRGMFERKLAGEEVTIIRPGG